MKLLQELPPSVSSAVGIVFVLLGTAAVWLTFDASRRTHSASAREKRIRAHRIAGYLFIGLFCLMVWLMLLRVRSSPEELPVRWMLHVLLALVLTPLLLVKVLVARYYKTFTSVLVPLGLTIFTLGFVLIGSSAGPYLLRSSPVERLSLQDPKRVTEIDLPSAEQLTLKRCSRCHALDRVIGARKDAAAWLGTVHRMKALPGAGISDTDANIILSYLIAKNSIDSSNALGELSVGRDLTDSRCARCHNLDRIYKAAKSPEDWRATVKRMVAYAEDSQGSFKPGEDERIIKFLSATQTPEAAAARLSSAPDPAGDHAPTGRKTDIVAQVDAPGARSTFVVALFLAAGVVTLIWRRPKATPLAAVQPVRAEPPDMGKRFLLQLVRIERQTYNCVSLRFRVAGSDAFRARPGQFLTFDWLIDGQRQIRSYSISSSPTQTGFVEVTVKTVPDGCVSTFLNERAPASLTVEARGPSGRFCLDEKMHRDVVLFAGGSGITPIMSMLRYIDDLCLQTKATLFYSVRTQRDIIFERELQALDERLDNFKRLIVVTKPEEGWAGPAGHLSRDMIVEQLGQVNEQMFFLCGPEAFMEHVGTILQSLGVAPNRILREKFGGKRASTQTGLEAGEPVGTIEFARSARTFALPAGSTLLEAAEMNGISIPYSCRQGQCGTCATRLLSGEIKMDCEGGLQPALRSQGYILPCVARAQGNVGLDA
jgi:ferredoxin-NADP reductase